MWIGLMCGVGRKDEHDVCWRWEGYSGVPGYANWKREQHLHNGEDCRKGERCAAMGDQDGQLHDCPCTEACGVSSTLPFVCRITNHTASSATSVKTDKCKACLAQGKDYCITDMRCTTRASRTCNSKEDHITGDPSFGGEGHSTDCSHAAHKETCVDGPVAAFTCSDSAFEGCCPGTEMGDRCGDCCIHMAVLMTVPILLISCTLGCIVCCLCLCRKKKQCCWAIPKVAAPYGQPVTYTPHQAIVIGQPITGDPVVTQAAMKGSNETSGGSP